MLAQSARRAGLLSRAAAAAAAGAGRDTAIKSAVASSTHYHYNMRLRHKSTAGQSSKQHKAADSGGTWVSCG